jgi:hypothetical protein
VKPCWINFSHCKKSVEFSEDDHGFILGELVLVTGWWILY